MSTIHWGILGGVDGEEELGIPPLVRTQGSEIFAIVCQSKRRAAEIAQQYGISRIYADAQSLVADSEIDAVYIAAPASLHLEYAALAAEAHKSILCEAPMATGSAYAQAIVDMCRDDGISLTVAYYRRLWYITRAIRRLLRERAVGDVVQARVEFTGRTEDYSARTSRQNTDMLANLGSHWIDLVRLFLGEIREVEAYSLPKQPSSECEQTLVAQMQTATGALVSFTMTRQTPVHMDEIEILGTEGRLFGSPFSDGRYLLQRPNRQPELVEFPHIGPVHTELVSDLIPRLQGGESAPIPGEEAVAAWKVIEAIRRSAIQGKRTRVE